MASYLPARHRFGYLVSWLYFEEMNAIASFHPYGGEPSNIEDTCIPPVDSTGYFHVVYDTGPRVTGDGTTVVREVGKLGGNRPG